MAIDKSKAAGENQIDQDAAPVGVESVTTVTPAKADESSAPGPFDAKQNDPPVRTNRPDVPIAQVLASGAGAHAGRELNDDGVDADGFDRDGRFVGKP
jgi:hypothetical protein